MYSVFDVEDRIEDALENSNLFSPGLVVVPVCSPRTMCLGRLNRQFRLVEK